MLLSLNVRSVTENRYVAGSCMSEHESVRFEVAPRTEGDLVEDYKSRGLDEVLVTDAFDAEGNYLPRKTGIRAVYAKHPQVSKKKLSHLYLFGNSFDGPDILT